MSAEFSWKQKWLAITPKPFAVLSITGSMYIIKHIVTSPQRRGSVYHRLLLGLSIYDFMTSSAVFMGSWPIPSGTDGVYLASGTVNTCAAQGFFIQNGIGTPLYNASLGLYYVLVVFLGWKEDQLKKVEPFLHFFPIGFSVTTAVIAAATDSYRSSNVWCWITSSNTAFRMGFFYGPVWAAMATVAISMFLIYYKVLVQERKVMKYQHAASIVQNSVAGGNNEASASMSTPTDSPSSSIRRRSIFNRRQSQPPSTLRQSRRIASQGLFYVVSFFLTFVFPSWARVSQMVSGTSPFAVTALFAVFFPLQGFFNAMVYFRPRYLRYRQANPDVGICRILWRGLRSLSPKRESMFHVQNSSQASGRCTKASINNPTARDSMSVKIEVENAAAAIPHQASVSGGSDNDDNAYSQTTLKAERLHHALYGKPIAEVHGDVDEEEEEKVEDMDQF
ncbi:expressed unknown protein [Seminavis robusta]|uniref:G-protein coupled receptors family 2 profile 2 domain-containing protein n=1 Tax=Seminavis robusta TaxID=568900 RepID=A0A9N8H748_9STRA|nr:expressed unknown protein [Seminavis robusta]|eukprot:Sro131_g062150.1 n/a (448) ;mRNA; f:11999-13548